MTTFRQESIDGHHISVLKSALQKYIRRGDVDKALWVCSRLDAFRDASDQHGGERIRTNFLHRLMVIFLEDIGFCGLGDWGVIDHALLDVCIGGRKCPGRRRDAEIRMIKMAVRLMCSRDKSRNCSHIRAFAIAEPSHLAGTKLDGNPLPTGSISCAVLARQLFTTGDDAERFDMIAAYYPNDGRIQLAQKWYRELKLREQFMTWCVLLSDMVSHADALKEWHVRVGREAFSFEAAAAKALEESAKESGDWSEFEGVDLHFEDYVIDKHTNSRNRNRSTEFFAEHGAVVIPESKRVNPLLKWFYMKERGVTVGPEPEDDGGHWRKFMSIPLVKRGDSAAQEEEEARCQKRPRVEVAGMSGCAAAASVDASISQGEAPASAAPSCGDVAAAGSTDEVAAAASHATAEYRYESKFGELVTRIQLTTAASKTDVYMVRRDDQLYVVKGPYKTDEVIDRYIAYQQEKRSMGMPVLQVWKEMLIPDRWPEGTALGVRNRLQRGPGIHRAYPFLVSLSVLRMEDLVVRSHESKVWPTTTVLSPNEVPAHFRALRELGVEQERIDVLNAMGYRKLRGLGDLAMRNFLRVDGRIVSIDEECVRSGGLDLSHELTRENYTVLSEWYATYGDKMVPSLRDVLSREFQHCKRM